MKKRAIIWILSVVLSACSVVGGQKVPPHPRITESMIQAWIDDQAFGKAVDALNETKQTDPLFAELRLQLESELSAYENDLIPRIDKLIKQDQWAEALAEIDRGIANIPNNVALNQHLSKIRERQNLEVDVVQNDVLKFTGEHMARLLSAYETIVTIKPRDKTAISRLTIARNEAEELAVQICELGLKALSNGNKKHGAYLLKLATTLTLNPVVLNAYNDFQSIQTNLALRKNNKPKQLKTQQKRKPETQELENAIEKFEDSFKTKRYNEAKKTLDQIRKNPKHRKIIAAREKKLQKAIAERIDLLYLEGANYYSKENYELALERWLTVLKLQPEHEKAKEYTERTKRILAKLKQLRKKQHASK